MANIRIDVDYTIKDGTELVFRSPCDCTEITGLIVYYATEDGTASKEFALADAHGENVGDIPHLFVGNVVVKVILDVDSGMAFVQNADTNAYLEAQFAGKAPIDHTHTASDVGARPNTWLPTIADIGAAPAGFSLGGSKSISVDEIDSTTAPGFYHIAGTMTANNVTANYWYMVVAGYGSGNLHCMQKLFPITTYRVELMRISQSGTWNDWECVNSPMVVGKEYRTTERWDGKAVYTKLLDLGSLPANSTATYSGGMTTATKVHSMELIACNSDYQYIPLAYESGITSAFFNRGSAQFIIKTNTTYNNIVNVYLKVKYTDNR